MKSCAIKLRWKYFICLCLLMLVSVNQFIGKAQTVVAYSSTYKTLDSLLNQKAYFRARDYYVSHGKSLTSNENFMAGARIDNFFNRIDASHKQIALLLNQSDSHLSDSLTSAFKEIELINLVRMGEYAKAFEVNQQLLNQYKPYLNKNTLEDYENSQILWKSLSGQPKQFLLKKSDTRLPIYRDNAGLANLKVSVGKDTAHFIFDTGANISVLTESMAKKFGIHRLDSFIAVRSFTGIEVKSGIGVCDLLKLGNIDISHAYFLIFPDSALAIPQIKLQINGILGFPVIEALQEIQITQSEEFIIPKVLSLASEKNMALQFLTPIIGINKDSYFFDTGAQSSTLFNTYYERYKKEIESNYKETDLNFGSAGGNVFKRGFNVKFTSTINQTPFTLPSVMVLKEMIKPDDQYIFGNIGQDLIKQFGKMTINFKDMFIKFD